MRVKGVDNGLSRPQRGRSPYSTKKRNLVRHLPHHYLHLFLLVHLWVAWCIYSKQQSLYAHFSLWWRMKTSIRFLHNPIMYRIKYQFSDTLKSANHKCRNATSYRMISFTATWYDQLRFERISKSYFYIHMSFLPVLSTG